MEIIIIDPTYDRDDSKRSQFLADLKIDFTELTGEINTLEADVGFGADWPAVLTILGGLFLLGKPIDENIDAWFSLAKKFKKVIDKIKARSWQYRIDDSGASLIALEEIANTEKGNVESVRKIEFKRIELSTFPLKSPTHLDQHPNNLYIQSYIVNDSTLYVIGIKSKGTVEFIHVYETSHMKF